MPTLLERVRHISQLILQPYGEPVVFSDLAHSLSEAMNANAYVIDTAGVVLGFSLVAGHQCPALARIQRGYRVPDEMVAALGRVAESQVNVPATPGRCVIDPETDCPYESRYNTFIPIANRGERLGTLVLDTLEGQLGEEDLVLGEYCASVIGVEMMRLRILHAGENERKKAAVQVVLKTLSYSEMLAIEAIFQELGGDEGIITAAKVADQAGITRSVIVNALRKLESAGIINARSLGMKGTFIRLLNREFLKAIEEVSV